MASPFATVLPGSALIPKILPGMGAVTATEPWAPAAGAGAAALGAALGAGAAALDAGAAPVEAPSSTVTS